MSNIHCGDVIVINKEVVRQMPQRFGLTDPVLEGLAGEQVIHRINLDGFVELEGRVDRHGFPVYAPINACIKVREGEEA